MRRYRISLFPQGPRHRRGDVVETIDFIEVKICANVPDPQQGLPAGWQPNDHIEFQQINIVEIDNPFTQQDAAVFRELPGLTWTPLVNPLDAERLELAFVITGEPPAVPALLLLVGLTVVMLRLRKIRP